MAFQVHTGTLTFGIVMATSTLKQPHFPQLRRNISYRGQLEVNSYLLMLLNIVPLMFCRKHFFVRSPADHPLPTH